MALAGALAPALAACGGDSAGDVLSETAGNLRDIRSGGLSMRFEVEPRGASGALGEVGFALRGPFALPARGGLPRARVAYTQSAGGRQATVTLIATGREAFVEVGGRAYELAAKQADRLRLRRGREEVARRIPIGSWIEDPKLSDGGEVAGVETDRISGDLDVERVVDDLYRISGALGAGDLPGVPPPRGEGAERLERAAEDARFELLTGKDDRLLRRLRMELSLRPTEEVPEVSRVRLLFALGIDRPNTPVTVAAPRDPLPPSALRSAGD